MFDTLRDEILWRWRKSDRLLEQMGNPEYTPRQCWDCGEWYMADRGTFLYDGSCEKCLNAMWKDTPHRPTLQQRFLIAFSLLRNGPYDNWQNARYGWRYVAPMLKAVLCLIIDHQYPRTDGYNRMEDVGSVTMPGSDGWWIVNVHPKKWGYELDFDTPDYGY